MMNFNYFDNQVDLNKLRNDIDEIQKNQVGQTQYEEVPDGEYVMSVEHLELGATRDGRPMFKCQVRLEDGLGEVEQAHLAKYKNKKPCLFFNRVMFGTKNDSSMIASVVTWLNKLNLEPAVVFAGYDDFAHELQAVNDEIRGNRYQIRYEKNAFNPVSFLG